MRPLFQYLGAIAFIFGSLLVYIVPSLPKTFALTTTTITVTGINAPDMTHLSNAFLPMFLPLIVGAAFGAIPLYLKSEGDFAVTIMLAGAFMGSLAGMLLTYSSTTGFVPIAESIIAGTFFVLWIWQGSVGGEAPTVG